MLANVLIQAVWFGISSIVAVLARKRFNADDWQTLMITAAQPAAAFSQQFWHLLAGWSPVAGDLLKRFYDDRVRGRAFAMVNSAMYIGMMVASYAFGRSLDLNPNAFRWYFPIAAAAFGLGVFILLRLLLATRTEDHQSAPPVAEAWSVRRAIQPLLRLREILRSGRVFYRYEAALMTYGFGWMICNALLPVLATDRLKMSYASFAGATQVVYPLCLLLMTYPMGWVMDRLGPAGTQTAMAGVHIGWMLGPVTLAPSPDCVAQYVAIHARLVGLRGIVAQGLGMFIYRFTGSFTWPFVAAALAFAWAALQMWWLPVQFSLRHPVQ